jgi:hypothetical protein
MAELFCDGIRFAGAAMHDDELLAGQRLRGDVGAYRLEIYTVGTTDFNDNHKNL